MPYRRLPTTDKARMRALDAAMEMASSHHPEKLAVSKQILYDLKNIKTTFENQLTHYEIDLKKENDNTANYKSAMDKARLYVSHFIQMVFMSIEREEMKEETLAFYGLQDSGMKVPSLGTEDEILSWGWRIMEGEQKRRQKGGSPFYNPSIALVKVKVENFKDAAIFQQNLKRNALRSYGKMQEVRKKTNDFISLLWNEIEQNLESDSPKHKRQLAQEYGVVYVFRRSEKKKMKSEGLQVDLMFEFN